MRIGALSAWNVLEAKESINFPGPGRGIVIEVMAIAAEVTISDGLVAYPIGIINGYERLEFRSHGPFEVIVENGAMSYKTTDLHDIGHYLENDDPEVQDTSFASPFSRMDDGIDPAIKMLIARSNQRQYERESYLRGQIEVLSDQVRNRANDGASRKEPAKEGAVETPAASSASDKPAAIGVARAGGASESQGKPESDAKPSVGEQPKA